LKIHVRQQPVTLVYKKTLTICIDLVKIVIFKWQKKLHVQLVKSGNAAVGYFKIFFYIFVGHSFFLLKSNQAFYEL
jgi:hypothetical protein